jgi:hypothetical protein
MIVAIIIHESWTSSSFIMRKKKEIFFGKVREIRPPQEVNDVWQTK